MTPRYFKSLSLPTSCSSVDQEHSRRHSAAAGNSGEPPMAVKTPWNEHTGRGGAGGVWVATRTLLLAVFLMAAAVMLLRAGSGRSTITSPLLPPPRLPTPRVMISRVAAAHRGASNASSPSTAPAARMHDDRLLGGLLSPGFDARTCKSRYEASRYRKASPFPVSLHLSERLRAYEAHHKKCAPGTPLYSDAVRQLNSGSNAGEHPECKYIVWYPINGLGNRMLSLASTFLFALLTDRVMLVHVPKESDGLFCEPFPDTTWLLPDDFPVRDVSWRLNKDSPENYVNMLKNNVVRYDANPEPAYVYFHLENVGEFKYSDRSFCEEDHRLIDKFRWILIKSEGHFAVSLFLMPMYQHRLRLLFPAKQSVFHHLGRYLFHPTNDVWGMVQRYYHAYLAMADEKIGIQIRVYPGVSVPTETTVEQILRCAREQQILPEVLSKPTTDSPSNVTSRKAVLVVSLKSAYYDKIREMYCTSATSTGEVVAVHQPSHEEEQHTEAMTHNQKALAEIWLLSFCDKLVTSYWSTFGYVSHSLAGLRPWILFGPDFGKETATVACARSTSVEPCLHTKPTMQCGASTTSTTPAVDPAELVPYVRRCEDAVGGLKLFG